MTDFLPFVGGARLRPQDAGWPPLSFSTAGTFKATKRRHFVTLAAPQYQAHAGSCYPHATTFAAESDVLARTGAIVNLCRMDTYFGARWLENAGAETRDGGCFTAEILRWLREYGTVSEARKAYNASEVTTWRPSPSWAADRRLMAPDFQLIPVAADPILAELEAGRAVVFAHFVYRQLTDNPAGGVEIGPDGGPVLGGHARCFVGYDLDRVFVNAGTGGLCVRNWWRGWGRPHPSGDDPRFSGHSDSYSWIPFSVLTKPRFVMDVARLAKPIAVEAA